MQPRRLLNVNPTRGWKNLLPGHEGFADLISRVISHPKPRSFSHLQLVCSSAFSCSVTTQRYADLETPPDPGAGIRFRRESTLRLDLGLSVPRATVSIARLHWAEHPRERLGGGAGGGEERTSSALRVSLGFWLHRLKDRGETEGTSDLIFPRNC